MTDRPDQSPDFRPEALDDRIVIRESLQTVELTLTGLHVRTSREANAWYDRIEQRIQETGEPLWFFLVDVTDYRIDEPAWFAFTRRSRDMQEAHSMGTVHLDASEVTRAQIDRDEALGQRDPNLVTDRASALARIRSLPSKRMQRIVLHPSFTREDIRSRLRFDPAQDIASVDFSDMSFEHSRDVNDVFAWIDEALREQGRKWYFLFDYEGTRIQSPAWVQFSARGEALNGAWSLGSVRYATGSETETDIRLRAESRGSRPNIRNTRAEALDRIAEMKAEAAAKG